MNQRPPAGVFTLSALAVLALAPLRANHRRMAGTPYCALLLALFAGGVAAAVADDEASPAPCGSSPAVVSGWTGREEGIARHGQLPVACLQALVRECSEAAQETFLDGASAALCSIRYEALLRHGFGGDFEALLAWWRRRR